MKGILIRGAEKYNGISITNKLFFRNRVIGCYQLGAPEKSFYMANVRKGTILEWTSGLYLTGTDGVNSLNGINKSKAGGNTMQKKILIIEDDEKIIQLERDYLEANGFQVETTGNGTYGLELAQSNEYDLILLDLMLPGMNGYEICQEIRKTKNTPVMMVSAKKEDLDKIRGLGVGADDYMTKPFSPSELVARVAAHIARYERLTLNTEQADADALITIGNLEIDKKAHRVFVNGEEIVLTNKEFELLCFLSQHPNVVFSKEELFDEIWRFDSMGETSTVTVHVNRIRDKIKEIDRNFSLIETVWGSGYRFRA